MRNIGPWMRFLRHVPPRRIITKIIHDYRLRRVISNWPQRGSRLQGVKENFDDPGLLRFAQSYQAQGARFTNAALIAHGRFDAKGVIHDFGGLEAIRWVDVFPDDASRINWLHDLSFFSFALPLAQNDPRGAADLLCQLVKILESNHPIEQDDRSHKLPFVWSPIALALRIMGLSSAAALIRGKLTDLPDGALEPLFEHIRLCAELLEFSVERYLGYNHQVFGEIALCVADMALGRSENQHIAAATKTLSAHLLSDGFWSERSPTYHIHMLLLGRSLLASGAGDGSTRKSLSGTVSKMQEALACVVHPDGEIAIFNDAAMEDSVPPAAVGLTDPSSIGPIQYLPEAGFARLELGETCVVMDSGKMGPDDVIGHGHGDFLSIEVSVAGKRLFVDPGVASISNDEARRWTRSAEMHNGPAVMGFEPAEFFGAWRVGRRGKAWFRSPPERGDDGSISVSGSCDGYKSSAGMVHRSVHLSQDGELKIEDHWPEAARDLARTVYIVPGEWVVEQNTDQLAIISSPEGVKVKIDVTCGRIVGTGETSWYPAGPMRPKLGTFLEISPCDGVLTLLVETVRTSP